MSGLLGDVIADLRRNDDPSLLLAMLDLPVAVALGERAEREGMPAGACAARAVAHHRLPYITVTPTFSICPRHG